MFNGHVIKPSKSRRSWPSSSCHDSCHVQTRLLRSGSWAELVLWAQVPALSITGWLFESTDLQALHIDTLSIATVFASPFPAVCGMEWVAFSSVVIGCWGAVGEFGRFLKSEIGGGGYCWPWYRYAALRNPVGGTYVLYLFWEVIPKQPISKANMSSTNLLLMIVQTRSHHVSSCLNELTICMAQQSNDVQ